MNKNYSEKFEKMKVAGKLAAQTFFKVRKIIHEKPELTHEQKIDPTAAWNIAV